LFYIGKYPQNLCAFSQHPELCVGRPTESAKDTRRFSRVFHPPGHAVILSPPESAVSTLRSKDDIT
jgi:hypothetical protein